jgi:regulator of sigma E protease
MSIIIFILVLVALIVVHELGHFFAAKWSGMKVEEFGIGYPPKVVTLATKNGTAYTLNWLPFGGFVKIKGEDEGAGSEEQGAKDSFIAKPHYLQALVILAGILMNLLFAWVLFSITLTVGMPRALTEEEARSASDAALVISQVMEGSPAETAGIVPGDVLRFVQGEDETFSGASSEGFTSFIATHEGEELSLLVKRGGEELTIVAIPEAGVIASSPERAALGVGVASVGTLPVSWWRAPYDGLLLTWSVTKQVAVGLTAFFASVFTLSADLSQVSGPLGIAGAVGDASNAGIIALLTLTAIISINLALINVLPIPALDGGRLLFVLVEWVTRRRIPGGVAAAVNGIGFAFLILLMLVVTASDIFKALG